MDKREIVKIILPSPLSFIHHGVYDFDRFLKFFDWSLRDVRVEIDFADGREGNYQALALFVLYFWHLRRNGCYIKPHYGEKSDRSITTMWYNMGAQGWFDVLECSEDNFNGTPHKPLLAIRDNSDFKSALEKAESYTQDLDIEYEKTVRYIISELLYNTLEHGFNSARIPSLLQFTWYRDKHELSFIIADLGIGIRKHLSQSYPGLENDAEAILLALKPQVSGTFAGNGNPYAAKNNAGVGLFISSNIVKRLHANMYIVSGNGLVHVSPTEVTREELSAAWPGTFVFVTVALGLVPDLSLQKMMSEFREAAVSERTQAESRQQSETLYFNVRDYFGRFAEDKELAIKLRDKRLLPAVADGKRLTIDFEDVVSAPHSLLSALLATPIREFGLAAYKKVKIVNALPEIRETIDFIMDENTSSA